MKKGLIHFLLSENAVYDYQNYQILRWFLENKNVPKEIINISRGISLAKDKPAYLRLISETILARFEKKCKVKSKRIRRLQDLKISSFQHGLRGKREVRKRIYVR
jgi:hypothetical protein